MDDKLYRIKRFDDYSITKSGKIYSHLTNKFLKPDRSCRGYCKVRLIDRTLGSFVWRQVHRLVATQFIPNPRNLPEVNHKDGNKNNNSIYNLEWCTSEYNKRHAIETGLYKIEEDSPTAKLTKEDIFNIYKEFEYNKNKSDIARKYNISDATVGNIVLGKRWVNAYNEYYGIKPNYKQYKRKRISDDIIKNIVKDHYLLGLNIIELERKYNISNGYISKILRKQAHSDIVDSCLKEINELLDNQQPNQI